MAKYLDLSGLSRLWGKITSKAVMADRVMSLSASEQSQARANIGAANTNPNLLRNWYWVGGGTAGKFPINQRGQNYYEANGYTIDGWKSVNLYANGNTVKVATQDGGLVLAGNTGSQDSYVQFQQIVENPPYGKEVTLSVFVDTIGADSEGNYPQIWCGASAYKNVTNVGLTSLTFTYPTASSENYIRIILYDGTTAAASIRILAIKLELGPVSTLEQDAAPDYGVELAKCQRDLWVDTVEANTVLADGIAFNTQGIFDYITPVSMRKGTITATFTTTPYVTYGTGNLAALSAGAVSVTHNRDGNHLRFVATLSADVGNLTEIHLLAGSATTITISNEP